MKRTSKEIIEELEREAAARGIAPVEILKHAGEQKIGDLLEEWFDVSTDEHPDEFVRMPNGTVQFVKDQRRH